jgi:hypothetical protein
MRIEQLGPNGWQNYHENLGHEVAAQAKVRRDGTTGPAAFAAAAAVLKTYLATALAAGTQVAPTGSSWSLSEIVGDPARQLDTAELDSLAFADADDLHPDSALDPGACVFAGGGAAHWQLSTFAESAGWSLKTCGSYLGASVAGAIATGVNGSALGYGAVQNQVRGLHLVTAPDRSVWIEPAHTPALSDATALTFADVVIREDEAFADALVHLGAMGLVSGVLVEMVPVAAYSVVRRKLAVDNAWVAALAAGDFRAVSTLCGRDAEPAYYEVQLDPFAMFESPALHSLYHREGAPSDFESAYKLSRVIDSLGSFEGTRTPWKSGEQPSEPPLPDLFAAYAARIFKEIPANQAPRPTRSWGGLHADPPNPEFRGQAYSGAFAIARADLPAALATMSAAMQNFLAQLPAGQKFRHLIYTLRFVTGAAGTMAFCNQPESVVIEIEGIRASPLTKAAAQLTCVALATAGIPFNLHWGKLIEVPIDAERNYGPSSDPTSRLARWRGTRDRLLPLEARAAFRPRSLIAAGVLA